MEFTEKQKICLYAHMNDQDGVTKLSPCSRCPYSIVEGYCGEEEEINQMLQPIYDGVLTRLRGALQ